MNYKIFMYGTLYEPIITLMFIAYWHHQNGNLYLLKAYFFCLFEKVLGTKNFESFCVKTIYAPIITLMLVA